MNDCFKNPVFPVAVVDTAPGYLWLRGGQPKNYRFSLLPDIYYLFCCETNSLIICSKKSTIAIEYN
jgi:hypothetical protein